MGGSIFVHNCGEKMLLSVYEKSSHEECPLCAREHQEPNKQSDCTDGSCNDVEIRIDQLSDKFFASKKNDTFVISPFIFQRLWVEISTPQNTSYLVKKTTDINLYLLNSSPATYILNRNIRN